MATNINKKKEMGERISKRRAATTGSKKNNDNDDAISVSYTHLTLPTSDLV